MLSGGIGGWVHRFTPGGPCYGCVASHLQRTVTEAAAGPAAGLREPRRRDRRDDRPRDKASIAVIACLHAVVTLEMSGEPHP